VRIVPLYHPAAAFYNWDLVDVIQEDITVLGQLLSARRGAAPRTTGHPNESGEV
jgi:hypothetical protein